MCIRDNDSIHGLKNREYADDSNDIDLSTFLVSNPTAQSESFNVGADDIVSFPVTLQSNNKGERIEGQVERPEKEREKEKSGLKWNRKNGEVNESSLKPLSPLSLIHI